MYISTITVFLWDRARCGSRISSWPRRLPTLHHCDETYPWLLSDRHLKDLPNMFVHITVNRSRLKIPEERAALLQALAVLF